METEDVNATLAPAEDGDAIEEDREDEDMEEDHREDHREEGPSTTRPQTPSTERSQIQMIFEKVSKFTARCKVCKNTYSVPKGTTTNLHKHARKAHPKDYEDSKIKKKADKGERSNMFRSCCYCSISNTCSFKYVNLSGLLFTGQVKITTFASTPPAYTAGSSRKKM